VQNAPRYQHLRLRRRMNCQRSHGNNTAPPSNAVDGRNPCRKIVHGVIAQHTQPMGPGQHTQRPIQPGRIVQVDPQRKHLRQRGRGGVGVVNSLLHRPRTPAIQIRPSLKRQRGVLMPHNEPIGSRRLIKQRCPTGKSFRTQDAARNVEQLPAATSRTAGSPSACLMPARLRWETLRSISQRSRSITSWGRAPGKIANPFSSIARCQFMVVIAQLVAVQASPLSPV